MGAAILLFSLLVGIFHLQADDGAAPQQVSQASAPAQPANYSAADSRPARGSGVATSAANVVSKSTPYAALAQAQNTEQLAQSVADIIAAKTGSAASVLTIALAQGYGSSTLGDVALLAATATKAAPTEAAAIAAAVTRSLDRRSGSAALAAAVATIISLVPEQSHEIGLVVGAILGDDPVALGMIAQTVAIAVGEETFSSLAEGSGVSIAALMKESSSLGIRVPFDVPQYAAQLAPSSSMVADSNTAIKSSNGDM